MVGPGTVENEKGFRHPDTVLVNGLPACKDCYKPLFGTSIGRCIVCYRMRAFLRKLEKEQDFEFQEQMYLALQEYADKRLEFFDKFWKGEVDHNGRPLEDK